MIIFIDIRGIKISISSVYRFLDKLNERLKKQVEQISFKHTQKILGGKVGVVFYDMTTIYFEASSEDELRKTGFSKDGKHSSPQIFLGLLVGLGGYAIGYDIFEGNTYEGHTLIPFLEKISKKFDLNKPIVVADAGINNRGYNKYLKMDGEIKIVLDEKKIKEDKKWDGLKGYITNTKLTKKQIVDHYSNLWHIEKAFRMSKTDLRIRPIYHRLKHRIEAHTCISFTAYNIYKELERVLHKEKSNLTIQRSAELTHNMYQINYTLPESKQTKYRLLNMDDEQAELYRIIGKFF